MVLNPNEINFGIRGTEIKTLKSIPEGDNEIELRYLSRKEVNDIQKIESKALGEFEAVQTTSARTRNQSQSKGKINIEKQTEATYKKQKKALSLALSVGDTKVDEKTIEEYPSDIFDEIWNYVSEMNHLGDEVTPEELEKEIGSLSSD